MISIETYQPKDFDEILSIFKANVPAYFHESEEKELVHYLNYEREVYFVSKQNEQIIGAGGMNHFPKENLVRIAWDFIHPDFHGKGIGSLLLKHRLDLIREEFQVDKIVVRTSQHVFRFYEKNGFQLKEVVSNYWAEGFDLYVMEMTN